MNEKEMIERDRQKENVNTWKDSETEIVDYEER